MSARSSLQKFHIPAYDRNAVIQLIAFSGVGFVAVHLVWITLIVYAVPELRSFQLTFEYVGMGNLELISKRWWTVFTYGWCHRGFWEWLSNMLWLYCFGNVVQNLVGYKQVIPLFIYSILAGGLAFTGVQLIPAALLPDTSLVMGAHAGIIGLMAAALTLSPKYRVFLSDYFSIPLALLAVIFVLLMLLNMDLNIANISLLAASGLTGFVYIRLLQSGYQPGAWAYKLFKKMDKTFDPRQPYKPIKNKSAREQNVDRILDKINEKGYNALTKAEKESLREAGR
ncbi:MAG: rhomboid family intramembrane serine protease [Chitinophagaceae bacterium]|nr:rhomboid family intramembrane serine protease [Chitinophagaceae bacterium]